MGLDLEAIGKPKDGFETEWKDIIGKMYLGGGTISQEENSRLLEISIPSYETLGAPIVGQDPSANAWLIAIKPEGLTQSDEELINYARGHHVLELLAGKCDGVPKYSNGSATNGLGRHTFRGEFLRDCLDLLGEDLLNQAWRHVISPEDAVAYGNALLKISQQVQRPLKELTGIQKKMFGSGDQVAQNKQSLEPSAEQISILESAGKWYIYWGERGHPIWANF